MIRLCIIIIFCIIGAPGKPMGPLEVTDVKANGCKLKWKKPEDDGGAPVDHYQVSYLTY